MSAETIMSSSRAYVREAIRAAIADRGLTQTMVARSVGMAPSLMSNRMSAKGPAFTIEELVKIAQVLGVDVLTFLPD